MNTKGFPIKKNKKNIITLTNIQAMFEKYIHVVVFVQ